MPDEHVDILGELAAELAVDVTKRYRIDAPRAVELILEEWGHQPKLLATVAKAGSAREVKRTRVYRDAVTSTKKMIYHKLRTYRAESDAFDTAVARLAGLTAESPSSEIASAARAVAEAHVSTAERLPHEDAFLEVLTVTSGAARTVLDVGAGVLPALVGADWLAEHGIEQCWAADKDAKAIEALNAYSALVPEGLIHPVLWGIADGWDVLHGKGMPYECEIAWLLKLVPVVARQEPGLLPILAAAPAKRILISGSRIAMAKRQNIERRERRVVRRFCEEHELREIAEHVTEDEFFILTERTTDTLSQRRPSGGLVSP